jgi:hypothetical protein
VRRLHNWRLGFRLVAFHSCSPRFDLFFGPFVAGNADSTASPQKPQMVNLEPDNFLSWLKRPVQVSNRFDRRVPEPTAEDSTSHAFLPW